MLDNTNSPVPSTSASRPQLMSLYDAAQMVGLRPEDVEWLVARGLFPRALQTIGANNRPVLSFYREELEVWLMLKLRERDAGLLEPDSAPVLQPPLWARLLRERREAGTVASDHCPWRLLSPGLTALVVNLQYRDVQWLVARGLFPQPVRLRGKNNRGVLAFFQLEVEAWVLEQVRQRDALTPAPARARARVEAGGTLASRPPALLHSPTSGR